MKRTDFEHHNHLLHIPEAPFSACDYSRAKDTSGGLGGNDYRTATVSLFC